MIQCGDLLLHILKIKRSFTDKNYIDLYTCTFICFLKYSVCLIISIKSYAITSHQNRLVETILINGHIIGVCLEDTMVCKIHTGTHTDDSFHDLEVSVTRNYKKAVHCCKMK